MIKALLFTFEPGVTWERILAHKKSPGFVFFIYFLPLLLISQVAEVAGLSHFGHRNEISGAITHFQPRFLQIYAVSELVLNLVAIGLCIQMVKAFGDTFHSRHQYAECLIVTLYSLSPVFLFRMLDAFPWMSPWVSLGIGLVLFWRALYPGIPRVLEPDPPQTFGLYLSSAIAISVIIALGRFLTLLVLDKKFSFLN